MRWVPTSLLTPNLHHKHTTEAPNEPPQAATSLGGDSINHGDLLYHTARHRLSTPTAHPELKWHMYEDYGMLYKPPWVATPYDEDNDMFNSRDTTPTSYTQYLPQPLDCNGDDMTDYHDEYIPSSGDTDELKSGNPSAEPKPDSIQQLTFMQELELLGQGCGDWADEMEMEMALEPQGEYMEPNYSAPPPAPPSPTPTDPTDPIPTSHLSVNILP
jgi:hypothetical protein